jgi:RNA polymerase sigma factor (sigma-70 family)
VKGKTASAEEKADDSAPAASETTALSRYLAEVRTTSRLAGSEEQILEDLRSDQPGVLERLIHANLSFVVRVAMEYRGLGLSFEDLLSEGNLGLLEAARRFDASRGNKFITYAVWWIRKAILGALATKSSLVRAPANKMRRLKQIRQAEEDLRRTLGRIPSREEVSAHLSQSIGETERILQYRRHVVSIDQQVGDRSTRTLRDLLPDVRASSPEQRLIRLEQTTRVADAVGRLPQRERFVLERRFGLLGEPAETLNEISRRMGLSRERVRQIEAQAMERIRRILNRRGARPDGTKVRAGELAV